MTTAEIHEKARQIAGSPILKPNPAKLQKVYQEYQKKTQKSAALFQKAGKVLPRGSQHTLPPMSPYPLFVEKGLGSKITDVDGNEFVDYILSGGAIFLGHNNPGLNQAIVQLIQNKTNFHGYYDELEIKAASKIVEHIKSVDKVRFTASGAEANLAALRIARSYTGKKKVLKFRGGYHGWGDPFMTDMEIPGSERFIAHGIPAEILDLTVLVYPNDLDALEQAFKDNMDDGGIAAVYVEPLGGESGLVPFEEGFHNKAIEIAHKYGALYVFDEVVTGFRMGLGGAQAMMKVDPDITTLGKSLMNGYPGCGAVCGKEDIMMTASTGLPDGKHAFAYIAGTLSGNALSMAAAYNNILELEKPGVIENSFRMADDYVNKMNKMFLERNVNFFAYSFGSIIRVELTAPHAVPLVSQEAMQEILLRRGIIGEYAVAVHNAGVMSRMGRDMISCAHTPDDNNKAVQAYSAMIDILE